ncbi:MAG: tRNA preQ1(34) S-adenosylmethionine ribosyltransferase-isomerase QueA [Bacilli bacterium]|nr:tRNA preQ1(34) S-adenosylmethionine ribosyltransferase-isomerase QueA [Bacilli bacterium]
MKVETFNYELPKHLIAQTPIKKRDNSRLLILDKNNGSIEHKHFNNIIEYLDKDDVLVLNDTKVIPARLIGIKEETNAVVEVFLLKNRQENIWECLTKPAKKIKEGTIISFGNNKLKAKCIDIKTEGIRIFEFIYEGIFLELLNELGEMPLPPYIHNKLNDKNRYQTVYAKNIGSVAAPTAGLHFTNDLLNKIKNKGIIITYLTLHVGLGTFKPVTEDEITKHKMHSEYYVLNEETANILNKAKTNGNKIISVGTTTTRTLETIRQKHDSFVPSQGWTDIFIYPPYQFKAIDILITNFHLPKSTLLMLVSAFASKDLILKTYEEAIKEKYRFFSFGDCMMIK